jgi:hypothetical protein
MNWIDYFERNRRNRITIPWELGITVEPHLRAALIRSLQRFHMGESGDGEHLKRRAAATGDAEYAHAVYMFMEEEGIHAVLLGRILGMLGAPLLREHWSHVCFVVARRCMGLQAELMVILIAEMVANRYYQILRDGIDDPLLHAAFSQMVHDESGHLKFHCDYLRDKLSSLPKIVHTFIRAGLWAFYQVAFLAIVLDHRELLRALGVAPGEFLRDCDALFDRVVGQVFGRGGMALESASMNA